MTVTEVKLKTKHSKARLRKITIQKVITDLPCEETCYPSDGGCVTDYGNCYVDGEVKASCIRCNYALNHKFKAKLYEHLNGKLVSDISLAIALTLWLEDSNGKTSTSLTVRENSAMAKFYHMIHDNAAIVVRVTDAML